MGIILSNFFKSLAKYRINLYGYARGRVLGCLLQGPQIGDGMEGAKQWIGEARVEWQESSDCRGGYQVFLLISNEYVAYCMLMSTYFVTSNTFSNNVNVLVRIICLSNLFQDKKNKKRTWLNWHSLRWFLSFHRHCSVTLLHLSTIQINTKNGNYKHQLPQHFCFKGILISFRWRNWSPIQLKTSL